MFSCWFSNHSADLQFSSQVTNEWLQECEEPKFRISATKISADFKRERFQLTGSQVNWTLIGNDNSKWRLMNYIDVQKLSAFMLYVNCKNAIYGKNIGASYSIWSCCESHVSVFLIHQFLWLTSNRFIWINKTKLKILFSKLWKQVLFSFFFNFLDLKRDYRE